MSPATQSSPTPLAAPAAMELQTALSRTSSPVVDPASPTSHQTNDTDPVPNNEGSDTVPEVSSDDVQSSHGSPRKPLSSSPAQNTSEHDVRGLFKVKTPVRDRAVTPSPSTPDRALSGSESNERSPASNKENASPKTGGSPRLRLILKPPGVKAALTTPPNKNSTIVSDSGDTTGSSGSSRSGLKLKLRCIQSALRAAPSDELSFSSPTIGSKRSAALAFTHDVDDTDSELDIMPKRPLRKQTVQRVVRHVDVQPSSSASSHRSKRVKGPDEAVTTKDDDDDAMFDASNEDELSNEDAGPIFSLLTPALKRNKRILDPSYPPHAQLIANASKVGSEYYDSDADVPGDAKDTGKPHLFRNVKWGFYATDMSKDAEFVKEPEFTQFVPGRFELLPDGTVADQKAKLVVKLLDRSGRKRIFMNPPPRDWNNQEAITALNKRTVQQIRRNTNVRFREVVRAYVAEERRWILANLTAGKPTQGWKVFVHEFNKRFEGKVVAGAKGTRPYRSHSSLTKEVERFGPQFYTKGLVPAPARKSKQE
ncbi:hypothetical protein NX059_000847 [Plenodomus lindquistii]|nr:hypothetical protein NX059_000847 [Plenodomus lindquistii]